MVQFPLFSDSPPPKLPEEKSDRFSNYIVYVDESGDHGLANLDPNFPLFVLAFCVFHKRYYSETIVPAIEKFKFNHFGHDVVVLHEHEIRKERAPFNVFQNRQQQQKFIDDLTSIIDQSKFVLISCVIRKDLLQGKAGAAGNPYHVALGFCLETLYDFVLEKKQELLQTHVVFECRGKKEDAELELEFRRDSGGENRFGKTLPFKALFADKKMNLPGLQLADLVARPIGLSILRPDQPNRAFEVLKGKFLSSAGRKGAGTGYKNWGLKVHPAQ